MTNNQSISEIPERSHNICVQVSHEIHVAFIPIVRSGVFDNTMYTNPSAQSPRSHSKARARRLTFLIDGNGCPRATAAGPPPAIIPLLHALRIVRHIDRRGRRGSRLVLAWRSLHTVHHLLATLNPFGDLTAVTLIRGRWIRNSGVATAPSK